MPVIYFHGIARGQYRPVAPVFVIRDDPVRRLVELQAGPVADLTEAGLISNEDLGPDGLVQHVALGRGKHVEQRAPVGGGEHHVTSALTMSSSWRWVLAQRYSSCPAPAAPRHVSRAASKLRRAWRPLT